MTDEEFDHMSIAGIRILLGVWDSRLGVIAQYVAEGDFARPGLPADKALIEEHKRLVSELNSLKAAEAKAGSAP